MKEMSTLNNSINEHKAADNLILRKVAAALAAVVLLIVAVVMTYQGAQKNVALLVDGQRHEVKTFAMDVRELIQERGITFGGNDRIAPLPETPLEDGMTVEIKRAVPVTVQVAQDRHRLLTSAASVGEALVENGVTLGDRDTVNPAPDSPVKADLIIQVDRVTTKVVDEDVPVPFNVKRESDTSLYQGIVQVVRQGVEGLERKTWEIIYKNGQQAEKKLLASNTVKEPVDKIVRVGTLQTVSRGGNQIRFSRALDMTATAYTHTGNRTSTGVVPQVGMIAVDPSVIPMGSRLFVEGYGYCRAMDVGSEIKGNRIDLFMETKSQALSWGRRQVKVYVLE